MTKWKNGNWLAHLINKESRLPKPDVVDSSSDDKNDNENDDTDSEKGYFHDSVYHK